MNVAHEQLVAWLADSRATLIFTGAGVSTNSGIPDFRGPSGVWKTSQPVMYQDFLTSEQARIEYWEQKLEHHQEFVLAEPNETHLACARLQQAGKLCMLVTQNIDGLHEKAGVVRDRLVELHGTNARVECQTCGAPADLQASFDWFREHRRAPCCATCDGFLKPATISFGQSLKPDDLRRAAQAAADCDLVIALGSSLTVYPAAEFPLLAAQRGVPYVIINRGVTQHDGQPAVRLRLEGDVGALFPPAVDAALAVS